MIEDFIKKLNTSENISKQNLDDVIQYLQKYNEIEKIITELDNSYINEQDISNCLRQLFILFKKDQNLEHAPCDVCGEREKRKGFPFNGECYCKEYAAYLHKVEMFRDTEGWLPWAKKERIAENVSKWFNKQYPEFTLIFKTDDEYFTNYSRISYEITNFNISSYWKYCGFVFYGQDYTDTSEEAITNAIKKSITNAMKIINEDYKKIKEHNNGI